MQHREYLFADVIQSSNVLPVHRGDVVVMGARRRTILTRGEEGSGGGMNVGDGDDVTS